jgi:hypothetical protein
VLFKIIQHTVSEQFKHTGSTYGGCGGGYVVLATASPVASFKNSLNVKVFLVTEKNVINIKETASTVWPLFVLT